MSTFVLEGGKVLYTSSSGDVTALDPSLTIYPHPRDPNLIVIGNEVDVVTEDDFIIDWNTVTVPVAATRAGMISALASVFKPTAPTGGATDAGQATTNALLSKFAFDAAGALEVSQKNILFNGVLHNNQHTDLFDTEVFNTGAVTYEQSKSAIDLTVSAAGDYAISKTLRHFPYFAGKSQRIDLTFAGMGVQALVEKRRGYFSPSTSAPYTAKRDGIYLYMDGTTHRLIVSNAGFEHLNVERSNWDDPLDGTGPSGVTVDFDNFTIFSFDFLWLGGKAVRFFVSYGTQVINFHTYEHSASGATGVMMQSPFQPIWTEIRSIGGAGSMTDFCTTVATEADTEGVGFSRSRDVGDSFVNCASPTVDYMICAIRLKDKNAEATVLSIEATEVAKKTMRYRVLLDPVIAGPALTWASMGASSSIEFAKGDTAGGNTVTGGEQITVSYQEKDGVTVGTLKSQTKIGTRIDGTSQIAVLVGAPVGGTNADAYGGINILENN